MVYNSAIMLARFELRRGGDPFEIFALSVPPVNESALGAQSSRAYRAAFAVISLLTASWLVWLVYHWLLQPSWLAELPRVLADSVALVETAAAFTLAVLWAGLAWHYWRGTVERDGPVGHPSLDVEKLQTLSPKGFERYVAGIFRQKGYRVEVRGRSGDLGVDLELMAPGGRRAIVQCKRYQNTVGPDVVRELYGTLVHERVAWGFLVTTAEISEAAREWGQGKPLTLIDGATLVAIARSMRHKMRG